MDYLLHIREKNPLVLNITNVVVSNCVANMQSATNTGNLQCRY